MHSTLRIRTADAGDVSFLEEMLFEAAHWNPQQDRPEFATHRFEPNFAKHFVEWGRPGDCAVIAVDNGADVGAAWYRLYTPENHSYGFVSAEIPELGIAVTPGSRSRGVGRQLLEALIDAAHEDGFTALSLSVSPLNYARQLYESRGFRKVGESGTSWTLLLDDLAPHPP